MMRSHCDRCDKLVDRYPLWIEDSDIPNEHGDLIFSGKPIWHIDINSGGRVESMGRIFCCSCRITILEAYVKTLKLGEGGHLADCRWSDTVKKYICADGCEIKRINEL